jgi:integrase
MEAKREDLTPRSHKIYMGNLERHVFPTFGGWPLNKIRALDCQKWFSSLPDTPVRQNAFIVFSVVMRQAVLNGEIERSPLLGVKGGRKDRSTPRPELTWETFFSLHDAASPRLRAILWLMAGGGLRLGEVLGLDRDKLDVASGQVDVVQQYAAEVGGATLKPGTKNGETRSIVLFPDALEALRGYIKEHPAIGPVPLFQNSRGRRLNRTSVYPEFYAARSATGHDWVHLHDLRHLALSTYARAGVTQKDVMDYAGHKDYRSSLRYQHSGVEHHAANVAKVEIPRATANG